MAGEAGSGPLVGRVTGPMAALGQVAAQRRPDLPLVPVPTGRRVVRAGQEWLVHTRHVLAQPASVWSALTRPERLERWVGTWRPVGDAVEFRPTFEGDDVIPVVYRVDACTVGVSFSVSMPETEGRPDPAQVTVELTPAGVGASAGTVVTLAHSVDDRVLAPHVATGCEYYLDRLVTLLERRRSGGPAADFDEYFISQAAHYRRLFPVQRDDRLPR